MLATVSKRRNRQRGKLAVVATGTARDGAAVTVLKARPPGRGTVRAGTLQQMPPVAGFLELDRVGQIKSVLRTFEDGTSFEDAAKLADAMLRDDRISGTTSTRWGALVASDLAIKASTVKPKLKAKKIAELIQGSDDEPGLWATMFPKDVVSELLHWGRLLGIGVAEIMWDYSDPTFSTFTTRVWHPQFLRWNYQKGIYQLRTMEGLIDLPSTEENARSDGKWIIYMPYGFRSPWRRAMLRPLAMLYLCRQWAYRDWSRYSEKHGMPADVLEVPDNAPDDEKQKVMQDVANRGSETALFLPVTGDKDAPRYKFSIVEPMGRSEEGFERLIGKIEVNIAVTVLGQNLTTEVQGGSRAAADVHAGVAFTKLLEDAVIADTLQKQGLTHWAERNYGDPALAPRARYVVEEPEDELKEAQTLEAVGVAVTALQLAGLEIDTDAIAAIWGIPLLAAAELDEGATSGAGGRVALTPSALGAIVTVNEARAAAGMGPLEGEGGGRNPDGDLTVAEFQAKHAATVATAAQAEAGTGPGDGASGAGDQAAPPQLPADGKEPPPLPADGAATPPGVKSGLAKLVISTATALGQQDPDEQIERLSGAPGPGVAGHKRTAKYADALKKAAKRRAAQALKQDLAGILEDVDKATSPADLRARLTRRYKGADATALRRVVERAQIMAHMAGRLGVLEEL